MARQRAAGSGDPGELLCHVFTVSGFRIMGFISRLSLAHHLPVPIFRMTVVLPVGTHISQQEVPIRNMVLLLKTDRIWAGPKGGKKCKPIICPANLQEALMIESTLAERCVYRQEGPRSCQI